eukprot:COSAG01_NODE_70_length_28755_cov_34.709067_17_plen_222_part_00
MLPPSAVDYAARAPGAQTVLPRTSARSPGIVTITSAYASRAQRPPPGCGKRMTINRQLGHRLLCGSSVSAHESGHVRTAAFTLADQAPPQHARGISVAVRLCAAHVTVCQDVSFQISRPVFLPAHRRRRQHTSSGQFTTTSGLGVRHTCSQFVSTASVVPASGIPRQYVTALSGRLRCTRPRRSNGAPPHISAVAWHRDDHFRLRIASTAATTRLRQAYDD